MLQMSQIQNQDSLTDQKNFQNQECTITWLVDHWRKSQEKKSFMPTSAHPHETVRKLKEESSINSKVLTSRWLISRSFPRKPGLRNRNYKRPNFKNVKEDRKRTDYVGLSWSNDEKSWPFLIFNPMSNIF